MLKTQSEIRLPVVFVYIYTTNLTLCVYTVHIQYKNTTWLLFIAHCFVKGLHLFLILWYFWLIDILEKQRQQRRLRKLWWTNWVKLCQGNPFLGIKGLKVYEYRGLCHDYIFDTNDKHNFYFHNRWFPFSRIHPDMSLFHPASILCKIIPQTEKH